MTVLDTNESSRTESHEELTGLRLARSAIFSPYFVISECIFIIVIIATEWAESLIMRIEPYSTLALATMVNIAVHFWWRSAEAAHGAAAKIHVIQKSTQAAYSKSTEDTHRVASDTLERLATSYVSLAPMREFANESAFTGVLGTLYYRAEPGTNRLTGVSKAEYLSFLKRALHEATSSYETFHTIGPSWFSEDEDFLSAFRTTELDRKVRILVAETAAEINKYNEEERFLRYYWHAVGRHMQTYWATTSQLSDLRSKATPKDAKRPMPFGTNARDIVVCDGRLILSYDAEDLTLDFEHVTDPTDLPYSWLFTDSEFKELDPLKEPREGLPDYLDFKHSKGVQVHASTLRQNAEVVQGKLDSHVDRLLAVLKSDAYGLGICNVFPTLLQAGVRWFGVSRLSEGLLIRQLHERLPSLSALPIRVCMLEGSYDFEAPEIVRNRLEPFVWRPSDLDGLASSAKAAGLPVKVHLEIDTGMNFVGVPHDRSSLDEMIAALKMHDDHVRLAGVTTQLVNGSDPTEVAAQRARLGECVRLLRESFGDGYRWNTVGDPRDMILDDAVIVHYRNSAAVMSNFPADPDFVDLARVGGAIFGAAEATRLPIHVVGQVIRIIDIPARTKIGYAKVGPYTAPEVEPGRYAVINLGYADGLNLELVRCPDARALVHGKRLAYAPTLRMNYALLSVGDNDTVKVNDEVSILGGPSTGDRIDLNDFAQWSKMSKYQVLTSFGASLPRVRR